MIKFHSKFHRIMQTGKALKASDVVRNVIEFAGKKTLFVILKQLQMP